MTVTAMVLAAALAASSDVVARVDGVEISRAELARHASELAARGLQTGADQTLESAILEVLLSAEARRSGLAEAPETRARVERERRRAAAQIMIENEAHSAAAPSEEDLRRLYHATSDSARLKTIVFTNEDAARVALALAQKTGRIEDATRAPVPGFEVPGSGAPTLRAQMPRALADAAFTVPLGSIGGPVKLDDGWGVFAVLERTVGDDAGFASRRGSIVQFVRQQAAEALRQHLREKLRKNAKVTVDEPFVKALGKRRDVSAAELEHVVAVVNGQVIRYRDIDSTVRQLSAASGHGAGPQLRLQILEKEIEDVLLGDEAIRRGLGANPALISRSPAIERRTLATALVERVSASVPAPTQKEVKAFYRANVERTGASLDDAREAIVAHLLETRRAEALQARARELRTRAKVAIDQDALRAAKGS